MDPRYNVQVFNIGWHKFKFVRDLNVSKTSNLKTFMHHDYFMQIINHGPFIKFENKFFNMVPYI
jgi:hypothetical protein